MCVFPNDAARCTVIYFGWLTKTIWQKTTNKIICRPVFLFSLLDFFLLLICIHPPPCISPYLHGFLAKCEYIKVCTKQHILYLKKNLSVFLLLNWLGHMRCFNHILSFVFANSNFLLIWRIFPRLWTPQSEKYTMN